MKKLLLVLTVAILFGLTGFVWACPGGDPNDPGECDTLLVICHDPVQVNPPPWDVHFPLLVTNDVIDPYIDSIAGMVMAFDITHTNPSAYCSIAYWKNNTVLYSSPDVDNSVFRHFGGMQNRMMELSEQGNGAEWDTRIVDVATEPAHFWFAVIPTGSQDQRWWEGSRILLATMTFMVSDTMTINIDNGYWPPDGFPTARFSRSDAITYSPQQNVPFSTVISSVERGDANLDGVIDGSDVVYLLNYLFRNGPPPNPLEAGDPYCDGEIDLSDIVVLIHYLFKNSPLPECP